MLPDTARYVTATEYGRFDLNEELGASRMSGMDINLFTLFTYYRIAIVFGWPIASKLSRIDPIINSHTMCHVMRYLLSSRWSKC